MLKEQLGPAAIRRGFFDEGTSFEGAEARAILNAYEVALVAAEKTARRAVSNGSEASMRKAQWHEAVAQTLGETLIAFLRTESGASYPPAAIELPEAPNFDGAA